ncbi:hypothetical protein [Streptomyces sp. Da 82-17]|uniref:hypothetical protein n=1 Tax=Streptomyces sp. Da 82-17 TaxID=3377116 RepID=UPI0038D435D0
MSAHRPNRQRNQAEFWNEKQGKAQTPEARAAVWYDACRMRVRNADPAKQTELWNALASHLHNFFQEHAG